MMSRSRGKLSREVLQAGLARANERFAAERRVTVERMPAPPPEDCSEAEWASWCFGTPGRPGLARILGWECYHTRHSVGSDEGFPDWVCVRDERVLFVELKRMKGRLTGAQSTWAILLLRAQRVEYYLWRPSDWREVQEVLA